jgi:hypothetical protein
MSSVILKQTVIMELTLDDAKKLKQLLSLSGYIPENIHEDEIYTYKDVEKTSSDLHFNLTKALETTSNT